MTAQPLLSMRKIRLYYGQTPALDGVDFDLQRGEIHALVGEHRAGKSSLVKILSGAAQISSGTIMLDGKRVDHFTPQSSLKASIGIVYQELTVIPDLNALENIFTGHMVTTRYRTLHHAEMRRRAAELFSWLRIDFDTDVALHKLPAAQQHMVEFARACAIRPRILILDELSNKLTPREMKNVYRAILDLKRRETGIIYISHDMDEILRLADRVTILKDGHRRGTEWVRNLDKYRLFQLTYTFTLNQEQLERAESKFVIVKRYLENLIHDLPVGVIVLDARGRVQIYNYRASELLGFDAELVGGRSIDALLAEVAPDLKGDLLAAVGSHEEAEWDQVSLAGDGTFRIRVSPLVDEEDTNLGTTLMVEDRSLAASINEYVVQSEKMASVAEVAVGVAHEINNPLFIIKNYLELVKAKNENADIAGKIQKIEAELGRIVEIVSSLLSFSRRRSNGPATVNVTQVVEEMIPLLDHRLAEKAVRLSRDGCAPTCSVRMDENRLKQVLLNLLMNSIDAVLERGRIAISAEPDAAVGQVVIRVSDDGYGIPKDIADNVFDPFFTTKVGKRSTGLGLSICRHLVEEHGGSISFASSPGEGTEFTVRLPAAARD
jgi:signal transduction histidine kinase/ABC-type branched-subunit amino acid transport system ATPase component